MSMTPSLSPIDWIKSLIRLKALTAPNETFPLIADRSLLTPTYNGGAAMHQSILRMNLRRDDIVILPAYCCGAELAPFIHAGCALRFYDVDSQLNADCDRIENLLREEPGVKVLIVTHYFGFAQLGIERLQKLCQKTSTFLLEDCAHALYGYHNQQPLGSFGALAVFSPRKSLGLTEGGLLYVNAASTDPSTLSNEAEVRLAKPELLPWFNRCFYSIQQYFRTIEPARVSHFKSLLGLAVWALPAIVVKFGKKIGLSRNAIWLTGDLDGEQAVGVYKTAMSKSMFAILEKTDSMRVVERRRANYLIWLGALSDDQIRDKAQPLFPELPEGCNPLYFPLLVQNPAALVSALHSANIESSNWWQQLHPAVDWQHYPVAKELKQKIVALPLHQELSVAQIRHAASYVKNFLLK